jgi:ParB family chromosome partitioning protein
MIVPNPDQPRKEFGPKGVEELVKSIRRIGLLQPIVVAPPRDNKFMIVAGERRWRACIELEWEKIPAIVLDDETYQQIKTGKLTIEELALIENLHREGLNPVEEAQAYRQLKEKHGFTGKKLAERFNRSPTYISERLSLLEMPDQVRELVLNNQISFSQARELRKVKDSRQAASLAEAASSGATVRQLQEQASPKRPASAGRSKRKAKNSHPTPTRDQPIQPAGPSMEGVQQLVVAASKNLLELGANAPNEQRKQVDQILDLLTEASQQIAALATAAPKTST